MEVWKSPLFGLLRTASPRSLIFALKSHKGRTEDTSGCRVSLFGDLEMMFGEAECPMAASGIAISAKCRLPAAGRG